MAGSTNNNSNNKRFLGAFEFAGNYEVKIEAPLDARVVVGSVIELLAPQTPDGTNKYQYFGMLVTVSGDGDNDGTYRLLENYGTATDATSIDAWEKLDNINVISGEVVNGDLILTLTDGSSVTIPDVGGIDGEDGVTIVNTVDNGDGTFTINYSNNNVA